MDLFITLAAKDQLWRNNGDGTFIEVTAQAGVENADYGRGIAWGDYNNDGFIDLYISRGYNDTEDSVSWEGLNLMFSDEEISDEDGLDFTTSGDEVTFDLYLQQCRRPVKVFIGSLKNIPTGIPFTLKGSEASGKPEYVSGKDVGFFIWKDSNGWHIRWSTDESSMYFYGKITSTEGFTAIRVYLRPFESSRALMCHHETQE